MQNPDILEISLVRHVPVINNEGKWYGRYVETDMRPERVQPMFNELARILPSNPSNTIWFTSDYPRAVETCQGTHDALPPGDKPPIIIHTGFIEQQYGDMEDKVHSVVKSDPRFQPYLNDMWNEPPPGGGESLNRFQFRIAGSLQNVADTVAPHIRRAAVFCHGGVLMAAYAHVKGMRMVDVFKDRKEAQAPSFSYMSHLIITCDRKTGTWSNDPQYFTGIPKLAA